MLSFFSSFFIPFSQLLTVTATHNTESVAMGPTARAAAQRRHRKEIGLSRPQVRRSEAPFLGTGVPGVMPVRAAEQKRVHGVVLS